MSIHIGKLAERASLLCHHLLINEYSKYDSSQSQDDANLNLLDLFDRNLYYQCFTIGVEKTQNIDEEYKNPFTGLSEFYSTVEDSYPQLSRIPYDKQPINYAVDTYQVNVTNYYVQTFHRRQLSLIRNTFPGKTKEECMIIQVKINGKDVVNTEKENLLLHEPDIDAFIRKHQDLLGISGKWDHLVKLEGKQTHNDSDKDKMESGRLLSPEYGVSRLWFREASPISRILLLQDAARY